MKIIGKGFLLGIGFILALYLEKLIKLWIISAPFILSNKNITKNIITIMIILLILVLIALILAIIINKISKSKKSNSV